MLLPLLPVVVRASRLHRELEPAVVDRCNSNFFTAPCPASFVEAQLSHLSTEI